MTRGQELTIAIRIDHNMLSSVADAAAVPDPIDETLARVAETIDADIAISGAASLSGQHAGRGDRVEGRSAE